MRIKLIPEHLLFFGAFALAAVSAELPEGVHTYQNKIFLSAAPARATFEEMGKLGVKAVIDLREPQEVKGYEPGAAEESGMRYYAVPMSRKGAIAKSAIDGVEKIVKENGKAKIWVYCQSANRAGAWLAIHLVKTRHASVEDAIAKAKGLGLSKEEMAEKVRAYLREK